MNSVQHRSTTVGDPGLKLRLFPASKPGELFASRVSRYHWQIGGRRTVDTCEDLFGSEPGRLTQIIPTHIWPLSERLPGDPAENLRSLLTSNTLYPIYSLFNGIDLISPTDTAAALLRLPRRTVGLLDTKLCLACVKDDFAACGTPYFHRSHQVPGVKLCHRHATLLVERCPHCLCPFEVRGDLFSVPWQPCQCGRMLSSMSTGGDPMQMDDPALRYAKFSHELLSAGEKKSTPEEVAETYRNRLVQLGFNRGGNVSREATIQALEEHYGAAEIANMDKAYKTGQRNQWLRHASRRISSQEVPIARHLLLAAYLFDSAEAFIVALSASRVRLALRPLAAPVARKVVVPPAADRWTDSTTQRYMQKITATLAEAPECTIEGLWVRIPGTLKRLLKRDPNAFEILKQEMLPKPSTPKKLSPRAKDRDERDEANAEVLRQSATKLYASNGRPVRISKSEILRSAGISANEGDATRFPLSAIVLNEYADSNWHFWARLYVWTLVQVGENAGAFELRKRSGLFSYNLRELVRFFSTFKVPKTLRTGQLVAILANFGIDRNWAGPCPEKEVKRAGRAYQRTTAITDKPTNRMPSAGNRSAKTGPSKQMNVPSQVPRRARSNG